MREIKFRVWCKQSEEMKEVHKIRFEEGKLWYVEDEDHETQPPYFEDDDDWVLMQYTGLKDKNGKEIYEGDILELYIPNWADCDDVQRFVINEYCPDVSYLQAVVKHCEECLLDGENDYIEVIGNIYETGGITKWN